ncbi:MAG: hypothetical protein IJ465_04985 [Clostridia bacterium]|nr:hypothetical protein [Clostridia bacterium]
MYRYQMTTEKLSSAELGEYFTFSISAYKQASNDWSQVAFLPDVSLSFDVTQRIVRLLNAGQIDPPYLLSFVSTFLDS